MKNDEKFLVVEEVRSQDDYKNLLSLRHEVFTQEQGVPPALEIDEHEKEAVYFVGKIKGEVVATGRFRLEGPLLMYERIAVKKSFRRKGIGKTVLQTMQKIGKERYPGYLPTMYAQLGSIPFYLKVEWIVLGESLWEAGMEHKLMILPPENIENIQNLKCWKDKGCSDVILKYLNDLLKRLS